MPCSHFSFSFVLQLLTIHQRHFYSSALWTSKWMFHPNISGNYVLVLHLDYGSTNAGKTTILEKMVESEAETGSSGQIWALGGMAILSCVYHVQASQ